MTEEEKKKRQLEYNRRYREKHPEAAEKNRANAKAYYYANKEKVLAYNRRYAKTHSLALSEYRHAYYMEHREKIRAYQRERYWRKKEEAA